MSQPYLNGLFTIGSTCPLGCGWLVGKGFGVGFDDFPMFDMGSFTRSLGLFSQRFHKQSMG